MTKGGPGDSSPVRIGHSRTRTGPEGQLEAAWSALGTVYDPELSVDLVSLGLVYSVCEQPGGVVVEMTLTTPGCPASEALLEMAKMAVQEALGNGATVEVRAVWDPPWSPAMMDDATAAALGLRIG